MGRGPAPRLSAIVAAAGAGRRFGDGAPKQLLEIAGRPLVVWAVERLFAVASEVVVAVPPEGRASFERLFDDKRVVCVEGGATRWASVRRGFAATSGGAADLVAIHDAARPALSSNDLARVVERAAATGAAILGRPVSDTLKRVEHGQVVETVDRIGLFRAETPQVFRRDLLARALERAADDAPATDESFLVEALDDVRIEAVTAGRPNPKLTLPGDLALLEALLAAFERGVGSPA